MGKLDVIDLKGQRFSKLVVLRRGENTKAGQARWICACDCGNQALVDGYKLRSGHTRSCGCASSRNTMHHRTKTHGFSKTKTYNSWIAMRSRCENKKFAHYPIYGGRGIVVCDRWKSFENFLADMGERPQGHTLDRIDYDGAYSPENCRWANYYVQANNRRNAILIEKDGVVKSPRQWADELGVSVYVIYGRLRWRKSKDNILDGLY